MIVFALFGSVLLFVARTLAFFDLVAVFTFSAHSITPLCHLYAQRLYVLRI